jgi:hypothetical protein
VITEIEVNRRLQGFVAEYVNRGFRPRDAVARALQALSDWAVQNGGGEVRIPEEQFEQLVMQVEQSIARFREEQARGAKPLGQGVYAEPIDADDFDERMKKVGLA